MKMRLGIGVLVWVFVVSAIVVNVACPASGAVPVADSNQPGTVSPDCVARIGDYTITRDELKRRWMQELQPNRETSVQPTEPVAGDVVVRKLIAERAMSMEGRKLGYLQDESIKGAVDRVRRRMLAQLLLGDYVEKNIKVTNEEIAKEIQSDPNLTPEQAQRKVLQTKARPALQQYYKELLKELKLKKHTENFAKAAEIHQRLLLKPKEPRSQNMYWITTHQIRNELSQEEKDLVLATFTGGQVTLYDWFKTIGDIAPPGRPKDLNTPAGVDKMLDRALAPAVLMAKAIADGHDENPQYQQEIRKVEDRYLMGKVRSEKMKAVKDPNDAEIKAFFEDHPEMFAQGASLKVEQVWCDTRDAAEQAKKKVKGGEAFEAVEKAMMPQDKSRGVHSTYPTNEGIFWHKLSQAEPGSLVGPLKGFHSGEVKWRIVKVHEKTAPTPREWSDQMKNQAKSKLSSERRRQALENLEAELLEKYSYTIYPEHFKDIDPLAVAATVANEPQ